MCTCASAFASLREFTVGLEPYSGICLIGIQFSYLIFIFLLPCLFLINVKYE